MKALALALLLTGCTVATSPGEQGATSQADTVPEGAAFGQTCQARPDDLAACTAGLYCLGETMLHVGERVCSFECVTADDAPRCATLGGKCVHAWDTCAVPTNAGDVPHVCEPARLVAHALCVLP